MVALVMIAGALVEFAAWWAVSRRGINIWVVMGIALPALGVAAIGVGGPSVSPSENGGAAAAAGAAAGIVLYLATRVFVAAVMAPGEELFWRGLFQAKLSIVLDDRTAGAAIAWAAFVAVNLPSGNLAIIAGAVVGGATWSALAWWTGCALASVVCHATRTALILGFPVVHIGVGGRA
jgi:membrane protease YdiL (CAAX protease family)